MPSYHIAFIQPAPLDRIRAGVKRMECRLSINRPLAWHVQQHDILLLKRTGGDIELRARARAVHRFDTLTPDDIPALAALAAEYGCDINSGYWSLKTNARYAVLIELDHIAPISIPREQTPRAVMSGWVRDFRVAAVATGRK